jgi:transposase
VDAFQWFVGIDWGSREHRFSVLDHTGRVQGRRTVEHTLSDLTAAFQWVCAQSGIPPAEIAVGLEVPRGVLVDAALEYGFAVFALNPKQTDRFRDRFTLAGAKDDSRDADTIGDALRTDRRAYRRIHPDDPAVVTLRELARLADDLTTDVLRLTNRLREQLSRVDAPWLRVCPAADEPWLWTLLSKRPDPTQWPTLSRRELANILRRHRIRRLTAADLFALVQQPRLPAASGVATAVQTRLASLVPQLTLLQEQRRRTQRQIDQALQQLAEESDSEPTEHRDVVILQSLPGVGRMVTATMLTETSGALPARDYDTLAALTGAAPVTRQSGKCRHVHMRRACNPRLRQALYHWARASLQRDDAARAFYDRHRQAGASHATALRCLGARWLRILVAMLKSRSLYDPSRCSIAAVPAA